MKLQFGFVKSFTRTFALLSCILFMTIMFFGGFILPVHAAGSSGWIEARVTVPEGFTENVIVCVINEETGDEYATRLMQINGYESYFEVPDGNYMFDGAFLENGDYRYNTNLTNGAETFEVSSESNVAVALKMKTTFNEDFKDGAAMVPPTVSTEPSEETETTEPVKIEETPSNVIPVGTNKKPSSKKTDKPETVTTLVETTVPEETVDVTLSTSEATISTESYAEQTTAIEQTIASTETVPEETEPAATEKKGFFKRFQSSVKEDAPETEETDSSEVAEEEEGSGFPWWKRILFGLLAAGVFIAAVLIPAYFYRRHIEEN